jgi:hypothetical protein
MQERQFWNLCQIGENFLTNFPPLLINIFFLYGVRAILTNIVLHFYLRCRDLTRINAKRLLTRKRKLRRSCFVQLSCPCYFVFIFSPLPFYFKICWISLVLLMILLTNTNFLLFSVCQHQWVSEASWRGCLLQLRWAWQGTWPWRTRWRWRFPWKFE